MALTPAQLTTVRAAVIANSTAAAARTAGDTVSLLAWLNGSSATLAWRISVAPQESDEAANYTTYDSLTQGKRDEWVRFLAFSRDFGKNKNRGVVTDVWGAAIANSISEGILQAGTELATNAQNALGGTAKTTGTVTATQRTFSSACDVTDANWLINN